MAQASFPGGRHNHGEAVYALKTAKDLDPLIERAGDAHCVMLGEASHGTHEFYTWRTAITKRLIEEKGFRFIAVEGDWPDCYSLNRYIKGYENRYREPRELLHSFRRWPTWMWANWETDALVSWLKAFNDRAAADKKVGFYGLDIYSLWESMEAIMSYLERRDPDAALFAQRALHCFEPYGEDAYAYVRAQYNMDVSCREAILKLLTEMRHKAPAYDRDPEAALNMEQNAYIAANAEAYYTNMMQLNDYTWNLRDRHMMETLERLMLFYGSDARCIIWAHNSHIGDARYTDMQQEGLLNIGQLAREQFGAYDTVLLGFGTYAGTVIAGRQWDAPMEVMNVPDAMPGSVEDILHNDASDDRLLLFEAGYTGRFSKPLLHRAIGVVYNPAREHHGNYVPTVLHKRYDAFLYVDQTRALHPLHLHPEGAAVPETYPFSF